MVLKNRMFRAISIVFLTCVMFFGSVASPAYAASNSEAKSFSNGFWGGVGEKVGKTVTTLAFFTTGVAACYVVDVAIAPVAPEITVPLATVCSSIRGRGKVKTILRLVY